MWYKILSGIIIGHVLGAVVWEYNFNKRHDWHDLLHIIINGILYCLFFWRAFGFVWPLLILFLGHIAIDTYKYKRNKLVWWQYHLLHIPVLCLYIASMAMV